jgi:putative flavoprotein involved in K+ transport
VIPGLDKFEGTVIHSVEYRRPQPLFVKKRVLVVGMGMLLLQIGQPRGP